MRTTTTLHAAVLAAVLALRCGGDSGQSQGGELVVSASAEGLGANGYAFPPGPGSELFFVDGWEVQFSKILVVIDNVRFANMPDRNPGNQGETAGEVARLTGPWILDLKAPGDQMDKGGAGLVAHRLPGAEIAGGLDLEQRYATSYDLVPATASAKLVNLEASDSDLDAMIAGGLRALLRGTATLKAADADCRASRDGYDWATLPRTVEFKFGLLGTVSYLNCQNPDNTGQAFAGEEAQRGVQPLPNAPTYVQITIHTDHFFWKTISHENLPQFNQLAANAATSAEGWSVDLDALETVPLPTVTDRSGAPIPHRSCVSESLYNMPPGDMTFDAMGQSLTNLRDFIRFNAATMGHLNADGLCYVASQGP